MLTGRRLLGIPAAKPMVHFNAVSLCTLWCVKASDKAVTYLAHWKKVAEVLGLLFA